MTFGGEFRSRDYFDMIRLERKAWSTFNQFSRVLIGTFPFAIEYDFGNSFYANEMFQPPLDHYRISRSILRVITIAETCDGARSCLGRTDMLDPKPDPRSLSCSSATAVVLRSTALLTKKNLVPIRFLFRT